MINSILCWLQACKQLVGDIFCATDSLIVPAFCFQIKLKSEIKSISYSVYKLIEYFLRENIAHNMLITRGNGLEAPNIEVIRIMVWPRKSCSGVKQLQAFNVAVCELSGWFPIYGECV